MTKLQDAKSFNLEHYKNNMELSKEYWTIKRHLENNKEMHTSQHNQKRMLSVSQ